MLCVFVREKNTDTLTESGVFLPLSYRYALRHLEMQSRKVIMMELKVGGV